MRIRTDDDVYRVDAVWLGPPKATFPWRARYVAWGVGIPIFLVVLAVERQLGIGFGFFPTAWAFVLTIALTRMVTSKISHERPLAAVMTMWLRELRTPRKRQTGTGGAVSASRITVRAERPRPRQSHRDKGDAAPVEKGRATPVHSASSPFQDTPTRAHQRRSTVRVGR